MKKALLFDLDDTLLDFKIAEINGLKRIFQEYQIPYEKEYLNCYETINHKLWQAYEKGEIPRKKITDTRFPEFFKAVKVTGDGLKAEEAYRSYLGESTIEIPGARGLLENLKEEYYLYLVTNGVSNTQRYRLEKTGFGKYFTKVFISDELGVQKPEKAFFDKVLVEIAPFKKSDCVIIGDSLTSDIQGGINSQIDTVWLNYRKTTLKNTANYEIHDLKELPEVLQKFA